MPYHPICIYVDVLLGNQQHGLCCRRGDQRHYWATTGGRQSNHLRRKFYKSIQIKVEKYDFANNAWVFEADLPWKLTGFSNQSVKMILSPLARCEADICGRTTYCGWKVFPLLKQFLMVGADFFGGNFTLLNW